MACSSHVDLLSLLFLIIAMWWRVNEGFPFADGRRGAIGIAFPPSPSHSLVMLLCEGSGCYSEKGLDSSHFYFTVFPLHR